MCKGIFYSKIYASIKYIYKCHQYYHVIIAIVQFRQLSFLNTNPHTAEAELLGFLFTPRSLWTHGSPAYTASLYAYEIRFILVNFMLVIFSRVMLFTVCLTNLFQYTPTSRSKGIMEARQSKSFSKLQIDQDILLAQLFKTWKNCSCKARWENLRCSRVVHASCQGVLIQRHLKWV